MKHMIPEHLNTVSSHVRPMNGGVQLKVTFPNGYGASVVCNDMSYGHEEGLYELAVLDRYGHLTYDTPITHDVLGHLTEANVSALLLAVAELPS